MTWRLRPGDRVGIVGVNGAGKTSLLRVLADETSDGVRVAGHVVRGKTVRIGHLSQELTELDPAKRVREAVEEIRLQIQVGKRELSAGQLLERLGFYGERQWTPIGDLSGGERRRLQMLLLLMTEPNVLLLDEPTNDLDIEMLTEFEDLLDSWPGTLVVVSHDRYFLERVTDQVDALLGDGKISFLPGGVDDYLERARMRRAAASRRQPGQRKRRQAGLRGGSRTHSAQGAAAPGAADRPRGRPRGSAERGTRRERDGLREAHRTRRSAAHAAGRAG